MLDYNLLDSGDGKKLEQFGNKQIIRPASRAVWRRSGKASLWKHADVEYKPDEGWIFKSEEFSSLILQGSMGFFEITLQENGQVGLFPEHLSYLPQINEHLATIEKETEKSILNLFGYTGAATVFLSQENNHVTHVDLSKFACSRVKRNLSLNAEKYESVRIITDDALKFCEKEIRRHTEYDIIIADPPGFSRVSKKKQWQILNILPSLVVTLTSLLSRQGLLVLTCHQPAIDSLTLQNIVYSVRPDVYCTPLQLAITSTKSPYSLPAGAAVFVRRSSYPPSTSTGN